LLLRLLGLVPGLCAQDVIGVSCSRDSHLCASNGGDFLASERWYRMTGMLLLRAGGLGADDQENERSPQKRITSERDHGVRGGAGSVPLLAIDLLMASIVYWVRNSMISFASSAFFFLSATEKPLIVALFAFTRSS
jgi:hypothetical protein